MWTEGNIHAYHDVEQNMFIHVPETSLILFNCHPYQLPCPGNPLTCKSVEIWERSVYAASLLVEWHLTLEWIVLAVLILVIVLLIALVLALKRRLNKYKLEQSSDLELDKLAKVPTRAGKARYLTKSELFDDFSSDHLYEDPPELHTNKNVYTSNTPAADKQYYNVSSMARR